MMMMMMMMCPWCVGFGLVVLIGVIITQSKGMKNYEVLCYGTAWPYRPVKPLLKRPRPTPSLAAAFITASHVVGPWRWPEQFQASWLQHVKLPHIRVELELRGVRENQSHFMDAKGCGL